MLLGNSLAKILEFAGYRVKKVDIINDRGVHICKSMLAYKSNPTLLFQGESTKGLNKKSDHFVGDCYIAYDKGLKEHPEREQEIQEMLLKREQNDPEIRTLRQQMNKRCLEGHATTYQRYGTHIDKGYLESDHYLKGKELVEQ
jgi:arginyl-tRNA synthetase